MVKNLTVLFECAKWEACNGNHSTVICKQRRNGPDTVGELLLDAAFLLTIEVRLLTGRLFYLRWGICKQKRPNPISGRGNRKQKRPNPMSGREEP